MKYETIGIQGTAYDLKNELNDNKKYQNYELVSFQTYKTNRGILYTNAILECPELKNAECCEERATQRLKFAEHFPKLNNEEFTTIRDKDKNIIVGDVVDIIAPEGRRFRTKCTLVEMVKFDRIKHTFLCADLGGCLGGNNDTNYYLNIFKEYYPDLTLDSMVWIYTLKKV